MSRGLRREEEWAQRVITLALGCRVEQHDDNSAPSMFDLRVGPADAPSRAIEVVGAIDEERTKTWNTGIAEGSIELAGVTGDWTITIEPGAMFRGLRRDLPQLLESLQASGLTNLPVDHMARRYHRAFYDRLVDLKVRYVSCYQEVGSGKVTFMLEGIGGAVDSAGSTVSEWVGRWLRAPERSDVLRKLEATTAPARDVFIPVTIDGTEWGVVSYLTGISGRELQLPASEPDLPAPVTSVWLAPTSSFQDALGVWWNGLKWATMRVRGPGID